MRSDLRFSWKTNQFEIYTTPNFNKMAKDNPIKPKRSRKKKPRTEGMSHNSSY